MSELREKSYSLKTDDGLSLAATLFEPSEIEERRTLVIASALGVPRYFYYKFARYFASKGYSVVTFDYRGIYESRESVKSGSKITMEEWGKYDIEAALKFALNELKTEKLYYLGHSCGGQLLGLAPGSMQVDRVAFVACQLGYWKLWPWPLSYAVLMTWQVIAIMVPFFDYLPTRRMGISSLNLPSGVAKQWAHWGKTPGYLFNEKHQLDTSRYEKLAIPLLSYHFTDDLLLAPADSVDALLAKYRQAIIKKRNIDPNDISMKNIGHFGFFKERLKSSLWREVLEWFETKDAD
ncbi:MAG TPA: alpha/beta fold hydrolase [Halalkalibaculum sp.]|nr:alpha/beta fold hydrolase [Halalkalibaculum sp.]